MVQLTLFKKLSKLFPEMEETVKVFFFFPLSWVILINIVINSVGYNTTVFSDAVNRSKDISTHHASSYHRAFVPIRLSWLKYSFLDSYPFKILFLSHLLAQVTELKQSSQLKWLKTYHLIIYSFSLFLFASWRNDRSDNIFEHKDESIIVSEEDRAVSWQESESLRISWSKATISVLGGLLVDFYVTESIYLV